MNVFDDRSCLLGEGPLWHPTRQQLFWFDILGKRLLSQMNGQQLSWQFDRHVSAAGWLDQTNLLIASERDLFCFDLERGQETHLCPLEADNCVTRSNDGRADPKGGFWIGTMGKQAEHQAGAIYRFYRGELRCLFDRITISNALCFSPCGNLAYFADTATACVMQVTLDDDGWPTGEPIPFIDLATQSLNPDGAVVDANGNVWLAQWGAARVVGYDPTGHAIHNMQFPASQVTCPAFGGRDFGTLFVTSASVDLSQQELAREPNAGMVFACSPGIKGLAECQVRLS